MSTASETRSSTAGAASDSNRAVTSLPADADNHHRLRSGWLHDLDQAVEHPDLPTRLQPSAPGVDQRLRPNAKHDAPPDLAHRVGVGERQWQADQKIAIGQSDCGPAVDLDDFPRKKVHGGRAHEARDEHVGRSFIDDAGPIVLLHAAVMHDRNA